MNSSTVKKDIQANHNNKKDKEDERERERMMKNITKQRR